MRLTLTSFYVFDVMYPDDTASLVDHFKPLLAKEK